MIPSLIPPPHRRSIRIPGYDYSQPGAYFVTITVQNRVGLFGEIFNEQLVHSDAGIMVKKWLMRIPEKFPNTTIDSSIVMPDHIHFILQIHDGIVGADLCVRPEPKQMGAHIGAPLPRIVAWFKTMTTNEYMRRIKERQWVPFEKHLWQRNYYEHIIRDQADWSAIHAYIESNPVNAYS